MQTKTFTIEGSNKSGNDFYITNTNQANKLVWCGDDGKIPPELFGVNGLVYSVNNQAPLIGNVTLTTDNISEGTNNKYMLV